MIPTSLGIFVGLVAYVTLVVLNYRARRPRPFDWARDA